MNGNDISRLSYKELQALALRYRVPGNIKKKLLVKVLQAARGGNDNEVGRLLQDLKQTRKRRVRKMKPDRMGITSTPLHSPNSDMADDYYCPPQQPHTQWVAAEEEIVSTEEEGRIPNYEEFKQFLLRRMQREYHTFDVNSNLVQDSGFIELRTATASSTSVQTTIPLEAENYQRSSIIAVNNAQSFVYQPVEQVEYQTLEDTNGSQRQGPKLLKKLLQAPVGANLGEIVSPVFNGYRLWSMEQSQPGNVIELDNSDTLTAESENNEDEGNVEENQEYYGFLTGIRGEYFLNEPALETGQQISTVLSNNRTNQYRCHSDSLEPRQYENWTVGNTVAESADAGPNYTTSEVQSPRILQTMYYENASSENLGEPQPDGVHCQYRVIDTLHPYGSAHQNLLNINPAEETQYYASSIISHVPSDSAQSSGIQNMVKYNGEQAGEFFHGAQHYSNACTDQEAYPSTVSQTFPGSNRYNAAAGSGLQYEYSYVTQEGQPPLPENFEQPSNSRGGENRAEAQKEPSSERRQTSPGILDPFWPKRFPRNGPSNPVLENILNLQNAKRVDLARLDQTSCVYCYVAPVVTHTPASENSSCSQNERFVAEYRQHCFSPYWMLYNDTSSGLRMANLQSESAENTEEAKDSTREKSERSMNWPSEYTNYDTVTVKGGQTLCEEMDVESTDCLFPAITDLSLDAHVEGFSGNGAK